MNTYDDIQGYLVANGFRIDQEMQHFIKSKNAFQDIVIQFSVLARHTVESFAKLAEERGWVGESSTIADLGPATKITTGLITVKQEEQSPTEKELTEAIARYQWAHAAIWGEPISEEAVRVNLKSLALVIEEVVKAINEDWEKGRWR